MPHTRLQRPCPAHQPDPAGSGQSAEVPFDRARLMLDGGGTQAVLLRFGGAA